MIVLFTDFGLTGPYTGQVKAVLRRGAPGVEIIDLFADAPSRDPRASAYLLAAYCEEFPAGTVFLAVVDPGVGSVRSPVIVSASRRWFVGPDNGLFEILARRSDEPARWWSIDDRPARLSASFHGRDLFAPVAARLAVGTVPTGPAGTAGTDRYSDWPDDLPEVIYIDFYGNAMAGLRSSGVPPSAEIRVGGSILTNADTFSDRRPGEAFWYENANGLVEFAVNMGNAAAVLDLKIGTPVSVTSPPVL